MKKSFKKSNAILAGLLFVGFLSLQTVLVADSTEYSRISLSIVNNSSHRLKYFMLSPTQWTIGGKLTDMEKLINFTEVIPPGKVGIAEVEARSFTQAGWITCSIYYTTQKQTIAQIMIGHAGSGTLRELEGYSFIYKSKARKAGCVNLACDMWKKTVIFTDNDEGGVSVTEKI